MRYTPALALAIARRQPGILLPIRPRPSKQYTIEQFLATTVDPAARRSRPTRSSSSSRPTRRGICNVNVDPGGRRQAHGPDALDHRHHVRRCPISPRTSGSSITRDQGGNENNHLYVQTPERQGARPDAGRQAQGGISAAGRRTGRLLRPITNERDARYFDLYRYDAKTYARDARLQDDVGLRPRRHLRRRQVDRVPEGRHDRRQRHLPLEHRRRRR